MGDTRVLEQDWYGADVSDETGEDVVFTRADLTEAESHGGPTFTGCTFHDASFAAARLTGAAFVNCIFTGCDFTGAVLTETKFVGSRFERCDFARARVDGGDWSFVALAQADLTRFEARGVRMREADLAGARCDGAVLRSVDLSAAITDRASFAGADLRGSDISAIDPRAADLSRAIIDWTQAPVVATNLGLDVRAEG